MADWFTFDVEDEASVERLLGDGSANEGAWPEAPVNRPEVLTMLFEVAREQVIAYAPAPGEDDDWDAAPPSRFVYGQLQQATNLWNAGRVASDGTVGDGAFVFTPRPLDKTVRAIIRPADGKPHVL